ncbi:MAG: hypothetical protein RL150_510 [Candidatus Parcubacteria bacterium]|jgi:uncharacterized RDD family membrane protein YckC
MENEMQFAGVRRRIVASIIDGFVVKVVSGIILFAYLFEVQNAIMGYMAEGKFIAALGMLFGGSLLISALTSIVYDVVSWTRFEGKTIGYSVMGVQLVQVDGAPISVRTALLRIVGSVLASIPLGLGYLWIIWDKKKQGWHDKIAGTYVLKRQNAKFGLVAAIVVLYVLFSTVIAPFMKLPMLEEAFNEDAIESYIQATLTEDMPPFDPVDTSTETQ